tara:strand:- start:2002 stop:3840 length:1839 start_codon:yes stop_codon:yes gene_type:complete
MNLRISCILSICFGSIFGSGLFGQASRVFNRELPVFSKARLQTAEAALIDQFTLQGVMGNPSLEHTSHYNWQHGGPKQDKEWAWFLNRHRYFEDLYLAYVATSDSRYANKLFAILTDWLEQHESPPDHSSFSTAWRPLEAARRVLESWDIVYVKLWQDPHFPAELKPKFLRSLESHGDYLQSHHAWFGNHLITEMLALLKLALMRPEAANSDIWKRYALEKLEQAYDAQFYPEGAHKELSTHYQRVVLLNYQQLITLLENAQDEHLLVEWRPRVDRMWDYFAAIQKPNGFAPLNNDSDKENITQLIRQHRGPQMPPPLTSNYFQQSGHVILRQSNGKSAPLWAFFDIGPRGADHQHEDFLHLSLSLGKSNILVDNGRYTYQPGPWRDYFKSADSHNILLVDGRSSDRQPNTATGTLPGCGYHSSDSIDAAWGSTRFSEMSGSTIAQWQRYTLTLPGRSLLVLDQLTTFEPRKIEGFWHGSPSSDWHISGPHDIQIDQKWNAMQLDHRSNASKQTEMTLIKGQIEPSVQGWHSPRFNQKQASPCLKYNTTIDRPTLLAWLFSPADADSRIESIEQTNHQINIGITRGAESSRVMIHMPSSQQAPQFLYQPFPN